MAITDEAIGKYDIKLGQGHNGQAIDITKDGFAKICRDYVALNHAIAGTGLSKSVLQKWKTKWPDVAWETSNVRGDIRSGEYILKQLEGRYTKEELIALAKGRSTPAINSRRSLVDFTGDVITIGYYTDTHIGAKCFDENWFASMWDEYKKHKVDLFIHSGDVFEGMTSRPGHVFECDYVGFQAQREYGIKLYNRYVLLNKPHYFIDGNHDRWFTKTNGANIVEDFCKAFDKFNYLGQDEGDVILSKYGITIKPWHGEDGNSYSLSYRVQKIVEAFSGGEKPAMLLTGHTHKAFYAPIRNIHCISGGAMSRQSKWMRSKRIENHGGFWKIRMGLKKNDIKWVEPVFYPFYK